MKTVVEAYVGLWLIMVFLLLCIAFTTINLNIVQARRMYNDIKSYVQAANGDFVPDGDIGFNYWSSADPYGDKNPGNMPAGTVVAADEDIRTLASNGYDYTYSIKRKPVSASDIKQADNETWIYNDIFEVELHYTYGVPLFGIQKYPIKGYTY